ncbi:alpha-adaptin-like protein [Leishmania infantum JPCM5]|uniref:AP-2 complex subunit alpha n=2 Tax=Leishmania infantum TaxID=5671 RepID=A0A6L0WJ51_LEIIN|nr:alpha-adaptin-like protein [Leishmania infantum JPCM5]CAC9447704.1 alpha-adaptin-like_protein [Leishmania infantum]CAM65571.1 alpha-adaptin-like protein [Leishmania infantum JPCM5]SUZ39189.1 alpha-adaptin-like_protein [Leishmania infantum]|eukprot:XP_001463218.1 alpha-adaptin-like protein [Leishmania infantum JPCM5]
MDMRGLAHFIRDIRRATGNKKEEESRVDEELAKIRAKFIETSTMTTYDRKKYVCKLMFISMLGYPITFGHIEGLKLMSQESPSAKLIGYLSTSVLLNENSDLLTLTTHTVYRDLLSASDLSRSLALTAVANTGSRDFVEVMHEGVFSIIMDDSVNQHVHKKALLTLLHIYRKYPEIVDLNTVIPKAAELLLSKQDGVSMCAVTFLNGCISKESRHLYRGIPDKLIQVLARIILEKQTEPGYVYYGVPAPWLQAKLLRLLQYFPLPSEADQRHRIILVLRKVVKATEKVLKDAQAQQKQRGTQSRVSAMNAVLFEVVSLCIQWDVGSKLILECVALISSFLSDKRESNLRYIGLSLLARLSFVDVPGFDFHMHCRQHQQQIIVGLHDSDASIRKKALDVLVAMCNRSTADDIIKELISYLPIAADPNFKTSLVLSIALLSEKYCKDYNVYVDIMLTVVSEAGDLCPPDIVHRVVQVVVNDPSVQKRAANIVFQELRKKTNVPEVMLRVAAFVLGEFGYQIALNAESTPMVQLNLLTQKLSFTSVVTQSIIISTFFKFYTLYDDVAVRERIVKTLQAYTNSPHPELQQRATEFIALVEFARSELLEKVFEPMPPFRDDVNTVMDQVKRLQSSVQDIWALKILERGVEDVNHTGKRKSKSESAEKQKVQAKQGITLHDLSTVSTAAPVQGDSTDQAYAELDALLDVSLSSQDVDRVRSVYEEHRRRLFELSRAEKGVLFSNESIELQCTKSTYGADTRMTVVVRDKTGKGLVQVAVEVIRAEAGLILQSRTKDGTTVAAWGTIAIEFAARSCFAFRSPPSVRVQYAPASGSARVCTDVLSLPILPMTFFTPYQVDSDANFSRLYETTRRASTFAGWRKEASPSARVDANALMQLLELQGYRTKVTGLGAIVGAAAFAVQPKERVEYVPVVCEIQTSASEMQVFVYTESSVLQHGALDTIKFALQ